MIILGIDPGYATMGYGVIEAAKGNYRVLDYGVVLTSKDESMPDRLIKLEKGILALTEKYKPEEIAIEELFFNKNVKTALTVAQARGVILLTCKKNCANMYEYTPLQIKQGLTGYGRAEKHQIQQMVKMLLNLKDVPKPDDAADALAVALCHAHTNKISGVFKI